MSRGGSNDSSDEDMASYDGEGRSKPELKNLEPRTQDLARF